MRTLVGGTLEGAAVDAREFVFRPGDGRPRGEYRFEVGTAGSATALALAILPVLMRAAGEVRVELTGGLFQDQAPSAFHLQHVLAPLLGRMGFAVPVTMVRPGYVPSGGGVLRLQTSGTTALRPIDAEEGGPARRLWGIALASHLKERQVSARMADAAHRTLAGTGLPVEVTRHEDDTAAQPGAGMALFADLAGGLRLGADGAGARGRRAERIGTATARRLLAELRTGAAVDRFAADQIIPFTALAAGRSRVRLAAVTDHVRTGLWLAELFGVATGGLDGRLLTVTGRARADAGR